MKDRGLGSYIGAIYTGTLAAADDIILTAETEQEMMVQIGVIAELNNKDRLRIHPQKTSVNLFNFPKYEVEAIKDIQPFSINSCPVPVNQTFTHLGIEWDLSSYSATATATIEARMKIGRCTTYGLMGAGLHGVNGVRINVSLHIYRMYVLPRML